MSDNICHICNNDGSCRNDDIYDCVEVWEEKNNILKGMWMVEWMKKSKKKDKKPTESDFVKWCKSLVIKTRRRISSHIPRICLIHMLECLSDRTL